MTEAYVYDWEMSNNSSVPSSDILDRYAKGSITADTIAKSEISQPTLLWQQRQDYIIKKINSEYQKLQNKIAVYKRHGHDKYRFGQVRISSDEILYAQLNERETLKVTKPYKILDIGTGTAQFLHATREKLQEKGVQSEVFGITAEDYRTVHQAYTEGIDYRHVNAEHLHEQFEPNSFDLIVSNLTFMHLVDPLGALVQAYETLKPNGVLAIDEFVPNGVEGNLYAFIDFLRANGYQVVADYEYKIQGNELVTSGFSTLIIRKTHDHLILPVQYEGLATITKTVLGSQMTEERAQYKVNTDLPKIQSPLPQKMQEFVSLMREIDPDVDKQGYYQDNTLSEGINNTSAPEHFSYSVQKRLEERIDLARDDKVDEDIIQRLENMKALLPSISTEWKSTYRNRETFAKQVQELLAVRMDLPDLK